MLTRDIDQTAERLHDAIRDYLSNIPPGMTVETIEVAKAMLAQTRSEHSVKEVQEMVHREADALGVNWRDTSSPIFEDLPEWPRRCSARFRILPSLLRFIG